MDAIARVGRSQRASVLARRSAIIWGQATMMRCWITSRQACSLCRAIVPRALRVLNIHARTRTHTHAHARMHCAGAIPTCSSSPGGPMRTEGSAINATHGTRHFRERIDESRPFSQRAVAHVSFPVKSREFAIPNHVIPNHCSNIDLGPESSCQVCLPCSPLLHQAC